MSGGLRTPSLRRRVTLVVLVVVAGMLAGIALVTDVVLENRLEGQLRQRLLDRAQVASALLGEVDDRDLARRLEGNGVSVVLSTGSGSVYAEGPLAGRYADGGTAQARPAPAAPGPGGGDGPAGRVVARGDLLTVTRDLPGGARVLLVADAGDIRSTLAQARLAFLLAALLALAVAAVVVPLVVDRALRPLGRITEAARSIGRGDRSLRLDPTQPRSELGRTALAFDEMLDDVTGAEQQAQQSEQRLRAFVSDAAHELRTPLTGVLASAEHLLREDPAPPEREQVLVNLVRETRRAGRLVEDLLLMARIDRGLEIAREPVDLAAVARQVVDAREHVTGSERLVTHLEAAVVPGDHDRLVQVVANLVDNALVHGSGAVAVTLRHEDGHAVLDVDDDGPGVPLADRERVFDRMVRLDPARGRRPTAGSGLGLPIARGIAEAHGGTVQLADGATGARFRLRLPLT